MFRKIYLIFLIMSLCMTAVIAQDDNKVTPPPVPEEIHQPDEIFYAVIEGKQAGPYDIETLEVMKRHGRFSGWTLVWKEGMSAWMPANQITQLANMFMISDYSEDAIVGLPEAPEEDLKFYTKILGLTVGPFNLYTLQMMKDHLRFSKQSLVWREGMLSWKMAKELPELESVFVKRKKRSLKERYDDYSTRDYNPTQIESDPEQEPLTDRDRTFLELNLHDWWGINPSDKDAMWRKFRQQLNLGKGLARGGSIIGVLGYPIAIVSGFLMVNYHRAYAIGIVTGSLMAFAGMIMTPLCAIPFYNAGMITRIYHKVTGDKFLTFLRRTSVGGGYDWDKKEVTVAMAIRL